MPPIFVDGVEIAEVWVDGVEQDSVWVDGTEVFSAVSGEDFVDTFVDANGTPTANHIMNTGQSWTTGGSQGAGTIQNGILNAAGKQASQVSGSGSISQQLFPIVDIVNVSFVTTVSFNWSQPNSLATQSIIYLDTVDRTTYLNVQPVFGTSQAIFQLNGVQQFFNFSTIDQTGCISKIFFDGVDIAAEVVMYPSGQRAVFPRQAAAGVVNVAGRTFNTNYAPVFGTPAITLQTFDVSEISMPPADIPWPT